MLVKKKKKEKEGKTGKQRQESKERKRKEEEKGGGKGEMLKTELECNGMTFTDVSQKTGQMPPTNPISCPLELLIHGLLHSFNRQRFSRKRSAVFY